jgi:hypothetical protein
MASPPDRRTKLTFMPVSASNWANSALARGSSSVVYALTEFYASAKDVTAISMTAIAKKRFIVPPKKIENQWVILPVYY